jgi:hypothetical protein
MIGGVADGASDDVVPLEVEGGAALLDGGGALPAGSCDMARFASVSPALTRERKGMSGVVARHDNARNKTRTQLRHELEVLCVHGLGRGSSILDTASQQRQHAER